MEITNWIMAICTIITTLLSIIAYSKSTKAIKMIGSISEKKQAGGIKVDNCTFTKCGTGIHSENNQK